LSEATDPLPIGTIVLLIPHPNPLPIREREELLLTVMMRYVGVRVEEQMKIVLT